VGDDEFDDMLRASEIEAGDFLWTDLAQLAWQLGNAGQT
jgi:hypothetical protein